MEPRIFNPYKRDYSALSVKDLLDGREAYHAHLTNKAFVVGTGIGRFLIRTGDADSTKFDIAKAGEERHQRGERRLDNAVVRPWSWPCVLVFVRKWMTPKEMRRYPEQVIPPFLYLVDGRVVPTCVVLAPPTSPPERPLPHLQFPADVLGGGYPAITDLQGDERISSLGCLVTDGKLTYALTNEHAAGSEGTPSYSFFGGRRQRVGVASGISVAKKYFEEVYPGWPGNRVLLNLDAGLIRVDDVSDWSSQVYGIGEIGRLVDLHPGSITLDWIGRKVKAFGCASGVLLGRIRALFYRYKSVGGLDYVSDMLVGPRDLGGSLDTRPGDSGTIWFYDDLSLIDTPPGADGLFPRPMAVQWGGGHSAARGGAASETFAIASFLSTICRELDIDLIQKHNVGYQPFWGAVGHYKIAEVAPRLVKDGRLKGYLNKNLDRLSYTAEQIQEDISKKNPSPATFVGLADVPDVVWKAKIKGLPRNEDKPNHYANLDLPGSGPFEGQTLRSICGNSPLTLDAPTWNRFYAEAKKKEGPTKSGALPFRVWQIFDEMVTFLIKKQFSSYLCAAGILAHYVGDACQPLHGSRYSDGRVKNEEGVHSAYETKMLNGCAARLNTELDAYLKSKKPKLLSISTGKEAGIQTIRLMDRVGAILPPSQIFDAYRTDKKPQAMWAALGSATVKCMAEGAVLLGSIWQGAWRSAPAPQVGAKPLGPVDKTALRTLYENKAFLRSMSLVQMQKAGLFGA